jgi:hypothetical protein
VARKLRQPARIWDPIGSVVLTKDWIPMSPAGMNAVRNYPSMWHWLLRPAWLSHAA